MPNINIVKKVKTKYTKAKFKKELPLHLMILPGLILVLIFSYVPMGGLIIAFQKFIPSKGMFGNQKWIGFDNFSYVFSLPGFTRAMMNTIIIAAWKIVLGLVVPIVFALLLNEVKGRRFKKVVQTIVYLPYFMSWVILGGIFRDMLSPGEGIINQIITAFGGKSIFFLGDNRYFRGTMIVTDIWKNFGYGAIVYLAAILGIDTQLYEAAQIDGANRWQQRQQPRNRTGRFRSPRQRTFRQRHPDAERREEGGDLRGCQRHRCSQERQQRNRSPADHREHPGNGEEGEGKENEGLSGHHHPFQGRRILYPLPRSCPTLCKRLDPKSGEERGWHPGFRQAASRSE